MKDGIYVHEIKGKLLYDLRYYFRDGKEVGYTNVSLQSRHPGKVYKINRDWDDSSLATLEWVGDLPKKIIYLGD